MSHWILTQICRSVTKLKLNSGYFQSAWLNSNSTRDIFRSESTQTQLSQNSKTQLEFATRLMSHVQVWLQKTIHFAARLVTGLRKYDHITPALAALGWPGIREVIARRDAVNVYRALHVITAPDSLRAMFHPRSAVSRRATRGAAAGTAVLEMPHLRLTTTRRLFPYRAAASWNALPREVTQSVSRRSLLGHFRNWRENNAVILNVYIGAFDVVFAIFIVYNLLCFLVMTGP